MLKLSSIYSKLARSGLSMAGTTLTSMDRRTQAALIVGLTERLVDPLEAAYISVVWLAPGKLTRMAAARRREMLAAQRARASVVEPEGRPPWADPDAGHPPEREELPFFFRRDADEAMWRRLVDELRRHKSLPSRGIEKLVRRIRGERIGVHACRKDLRCDLNRVVEIERDVRMLLDRLQDQVRERIEPAFLERGIVLPPVMY